MQDESWSAITGSCTIVRDMKDMLVHSYYEVRLHAPPDGKRYMRKGLRSTLYLLLFSAFFSLPYNYTC
jgi:hypothetical protein